ncbi:hypothetical protein L4J73_25205 [Klebsiella pneumoniae]|uniref:hypothetical protein n=2 Tax=Klebsiella pneumoniae TaxID=573 RepID=UPI001F5BC529|nr:hypothetical protein [Klebsiella pneumoniae]MCW9704920.1 hypothetical protein [Klebsiella pneumoniae]
MMSLWDALRMNMMISYQELVRTFPNVHALRCITSFLLLLVSLWLPVKPAVINLAVEFAALVNFIASVTLYTVANFREKRRLKKQRKEEKAAQKG